MPDQDAAVSAVAQPALSLLFVCTGNTCRSPLAEGLCKRLLAERLGCPPGELPARGVTVLSAGVAVWPGDDVNEVAASVASEYGTDVTAHRSRPVNPELLETATHVIAMTRAHAAALATRFPGVGPTPILLCGDEGDLEDPLGGDVEVYRSCAQTIERHLQRLLREWFGS